MATIEVAHLVTVHTDDRTYGRGSRPVCSCGWSGNWWDYYEDAAAAGTEHRDGHAGPPSPFDAFCSDLLGVMDDLADAVAWLAETWPDDLPVPGWFSNGGDHLDGPAFKVQAYCWDLDTLARAATTLGVAAADDPTDDGRGNRYRRAGRSFGRVLVEAYASVPGDDGAAS